MCAIYASLDFDARQNDGASGVFAEVSAPYVQYWISGRAGMTMVLLLIACL
jgi:hypothetical protein